MRQPTPFWTALPTTGGSRGCLRSASTGVPGRRSGQQPGWSDLLHVRWQNRGWVPLTRLRASPRSPGCCPSLWFRPVLHRCNGTPFCRRAQMHSMQGCTRSLTVRQLWRLRRRASASSWRERRPKNADSCFRGCCARRSPMCSACRIRSASTRGRGCWRWGWIR